METAFEMKIMNKAPLTLCLGSLLWGCTTSPSPLGEKPTSLPVKPAASSFPTFQERMYTANWKFKSTPIRPIQHPEIEVLPRLASYPNGDRLIVSKHKQRLNTDQDESHLLGIVRMSPQGKVVWSKLYRINRLFNLGNLVMVNQKATIVGTYFPEQNKEPGPRTPVPANAPINVAILEVSDTGELDSKQSIRLQNGYTNSIYQEARLFAFAQGGRAISIPPHETLFLSERGPHTSLPISAQSLLKTAEGDYVSAFLKQDYVVISKFGKKFEPIWSKSIGESVGGINRISDLHVTQDGKTFLAYSLSHLGKNLYGHVSLWMDAQGQIQESALYRLQTSDRLTTLTEIEGSFQHQDFIYVGIRYPASSGKSLAVSTVFNTQSGKASVSAMPAFATDKVAFNSQQWLMANPADTLTRFSDPFSYRLLQTPLRLENPELTLYPDPKYQVPSPKHIGLPALKPVSVTSQAADELQFEVLDAALELT